MTYRIQERNIQGYYLIFMDYDCKKASALADALDADPKLDCSGYNGSKKNNMHTIFVRIDDKELYREDTFTQKMYIDAICKPILSEV